MEELCDPVSHLNVECSFVSAHPSSITGEIWHSGSERIQEETVFLRLVFDLAYEREYRLYVRSESVSKFLELSYETHSVVEAMDSMDYSCICCGSDYEYPEELYWLEIDQHTHSACWESLQSVIERYCKTNSDTLLVNLI